jgi:hypothetical protein
VYEGRNRTGNFVCLNRADLDAREAEISTLYEQGKTIIFLVGPQNELFSRATGDSKADPSKRACTRLGIAWTMLAKPFPAMKTTEMEFRDYASRFGVGYVQFDCARADAGTVKGLFEGDGRLFGLTVKNQVFLLPCAVPKAGQIHDLAYAAILASVKYRERMSSELPAWIADFEFEHESKLRQERDDVLKKVTELGAKLDVYHRFKGALCWQSEPLVAVVKDVFVHFFGIDLIVEDKLIEDAVIHDSNGDIRAVIEIKGVKGSFKREHVNQVDSHRERLGVRPGVPGILIMNTYRGVSSLEAKDDGPHPDIVKKAADNDVLLVRTLDLLRLADLVEKGSMTGQQALDRILSSAGWLRVKNGTVEVLRN